MAKYSPPLIAFNAGEWGPLVYGRVDLPKFISSTREMNNFLPTVQGAARKRSGTRFVEPTATTTGRLIPFRLSRTQSYMLEIDVNVSRVYDQDGVLLLDEQLILTPWATVEAVQSLQIAQTGNFLTFIGDTFIPTFYSYDPVLNFQSYTPLFFHTVITLGTLPLQNAQPQASLITSSLGLGTVTASAPVFDPSMTPGLTGFFRVQQNIGIYNEPALLYPPWVTGTAYTVGDKVYNESAVTPGRVNVYESLSTATSGDIPPGFDLGTGRDALTGGVLWRYLHHQVAWIQLESYISDTEYTYALSIDTIELPVGLDTDPTETWSFAAWSDFFGYPRAGTFFQQRLLLGGTFTEPQTFQGSAIADFSNFDTVPITDSSSFSYQLESDESNRIAFMLGARSLLIGTKGGEFNATGGVTSDAITPTAISIARDSKFGSHPQNALQAGEAILFVQAGRQTLRESIFSRDQDGNVAQDLSLLAHHIAGDGIGRITFQKEPDSIMWSYNVRDGQLIGMTYERQQEVVGWHRHDLGGTDVRVVDTVALPDSNGAEDVVWMIVERTIDGGPVRYVEIMQNITADIYSDSYVLYDDVPTTTITGLDHLEGETVDVIADGANTPQAVVTGGQIELEFEASRVVVGLPYVAKLTTQTIEGGSANGVSQGKAKRIHNVSFRLVSSALGLEVGTNPDAMTKVMYRVTPDLMDTPVPLFTGDTEIAPLEGGYDDRGILFVTHDVALPCIINAMWPQLEVYDAR